MPLRRSQLRSTRPQLYKSGNFDNTPDLTFGPYPVTAGGLAQAPTPVTLAVENWTVKVKVTSDNGYWVASPVGVSALTVALGDTTRRVTGGG